MSFCPRKRLFHCKRRNLHTTVPFAGVLQTYQLHY